MALSLRILLVTLILAIPARCLAVEDVVRVTFDAADRGTMKVMQRVALQGNVDHPVRLIFQTKRPRIIPLEKLVIPLHIDRPTLLEVPRDVEVRVASHAEKFEEEVTAVHGFNLSAGAVYMILYVLYELSLP